MFKASENFSTSVDLLLYTSLTFRKNLILRIQNANVEKKLALNFITIRNLTE